MSDTAAFSYSFATLQQLSEDVLKHARGKGATACEVDVSEGFGQSVTVRCDEVETIEFNRDKGIGITVYSGQRKGYASTSDFSAQALRETVEAALDIARFTAEDDCAGLAMLRGESSAETARLHRLERFRTRFIEDEAYLSAIAAVWPTIDLQHMRQLRRNALKELENHKPPKNFRAIFQILQDLDKQGAPAAEEDAGDE